MKAVGNIKAITQQRSSKLANVEIHISSVQYVTSKKDGRYFQDYAYEEELETPLVITGDCLARADKNKQPEGDFEFNVYDKVDGEYVLNENKRLEVTVVYDFEEDVTIISALDYTVTLPPAEFEQFRKEREKEKGFKQTKTSRKRF
ncbi:MULTISPECIES: hypothetical protein [Rufibacter]|uniref:Uncharacterized protein n=1 Tax=Rufibacter quisquiliarum TaxID=1549639 RepID=A0A839GTS2_9BACT|nr:MULTISPECIES: hypothetical protein [Rufibacter]MBA9077181.1 hypothetical protein [Rufibacter quisquiliarum]